MNNLSASTRSLQISRAWLCMRGDSIGDGQVSEAIRRKVRSCRRALRAQDGSDGVPLTNAVQTLLSVEQNGLPVHLQPELTKIRKAVLGHVLQLDGHLDGADEQIRSAVASMTRPEQMQLALAILAYCSKCEGKLK